MQQRLKDKKFTAEELVEVEKVARMKNIAETSLHFGLNVESFMRFRKSDPELEAALQRGINYSIDKIFTPEELLKVEELAETNNSDNVARYFDIKLHVFAKLKKEQSDLGKAYTRGVKARKIRVYPSRSNNASKKESIRRPLVITEDILNLSIQNTSPQEALIKFNEMKIKERKRRLYQELEEIDLL